MTKSLIPAFVIDQGIANQCLTRGADFEVYTDAMKVDENAESGKYVVSMVGSSTVQDLQGDAMTLSALDDMTRIPSDMTIFMNHDYSIPESVYGSLYGKPYIKSSSGIADLYLSAETEMNNPRAAQVYNMVTKGRRKVGCSVGCQVLDYEINEDADPGSFALIIKHVYVVEFSLVGIPASQRAWVEVATKSLFERALQEGRGDDALRLAPAIKGMFWRDYDAVVKYVDNASLKKDLERVIPRTTSEKRIMCSLADGDTNFVLTDGRGITQSLSRNDVSTLLQKRAEARIALPQRMQRAMTPDGATVTTTTIDDSVDSVEKSAEPILNSDSGNALNRQDLAESLMEEEEAVDRTKKAMPNASDVEVSSDGTHEACKGMHSHIHPVSDGSQGGDKNHTHSHEHSDDASHQHPHDDASKEADKSIEAGDENEAIVEVIEKQQETPDASPLEAEQVPALVKEAQPAIVLFDELQRNALMETYKFFAQQLNTLSAQLGFPVLSITDKGMVPTADGVNGQEVVSTVSRLDTLMDSITSQISEASYCADNLMAMLSIPDVDDGYSVYAANSARIVTKEGRAISSQNMKHLQTIHDCVKAMHPGVCAGESAGISVEDAENEARMQGEGQPIPQAYSTLSASFDTVSNSLNDVTRGLAGIAGLNIKSIVGDAVNEAMEVSRKSLDLLQREQRVIMENMKRLKEMPLGRPTSFVGRSITPSEDTATYEDLLIAGKALSDLSESGLETVERGGMRMKRWPQGYKAGQRPALTDFQKTYMSPLDYYPYEQALKEVFVPIENSERP